jgi:predicted nuclease of predicted toxin-antitoxin system
MALKFLVEAGVGARVAEALGRAGYATERFCGPDPGDLEILRQARRQEQVLVTEDKDFGELAYRQKEPHRGVILFDGALSTEEKVSRIVPAVERYRQELEQGYFLKIDGEGVRTRPPLPETAGKAPGAAAGPKRSDSQ